MKIDVIATWIVLSVDFQTFQFVFDFFSDHVSGCKSNSSESINARRLMDRRTSCWRGGHRWDKCGRISDMIVGYA